QQADGERRAGRVLRLLVLAEQARGPPRQVGAADLDLVEAGTLVEGGLGPDVAMLAVVREALPPQPVDLAGRVAGAGLADEVLDIARVDQEVRGARRPERDEPDHLAVLVDGRAAGVAVL